MAWYRPDQTRRTDATEVAPLPCGTGSKAVKQTTKERFNEMEKAPAHRTDRSFHSTIKSESECRPMASRALWSEIVADTQTTHGERVRRGCLTCHFHNIYNTGPLAWYSRSRWLGLALASRRSSRASMQEGLQEGSFRLAKVPTQVVYI